MIHARVVPIFKSSEKSVLICASYIARSLASTVRIGFAMGVICGRITNDLETRLTARSMRAAKS